MGRIELGGADAGEVEVHVRAGADADGRRRAILCGGYSLMFLCWSAGCGHLVLSGGERLRFLVGAFRGTEVDVSLDGDSTAVPRASEPGKGRGSVG